MHGNKEHHNESLIFSPLLLDSNMASVRAAEINAKAAIKSAEVVNIGVIQSAEIGLKGTKFRGYIALAVAIIGFVGVSVGAYNYRAKYRDTKTERKKAQDQNALYLEELKHYKAKNDQLKGDLRKFYHCSTLSNPFALYPCLHEARFKVESNSSLVKPERLT